MSGRRKRHDRWMQGLSLLILAVVAVLVVRYARSVDWTAVGGALTAYGPGRLAAAAALGALSYLLYGGYELTARAYTGHRLSTGRVLAIAFISYAFNLNLGPLIGAGGIRYRLYSRSGISGGVIARIIAFSLVTNWFGYVVLAGGVLVLGLVALPDSFASGFQSPRVLGYLLLAAAGGYLLACAFGRDRTWTLRRSEFKPPSTSMAILQLAMSAANWLTIAAVLFILLDQRTDYSVVLGVFLMGAIAAAMTHIPAGLGALEAVFLVLLGDRIAHSELIAALLVYRAVYYLTPLLLATIAYIGLESWPRLRETRSRDASSPRSG